MTHDRILVATDGSDPATAAVREAITFAEAFDATLYALYVLETAEPPPDVEDPALEPGVDTHAETALQAVVDAATEAGFENEIVQAVVRGRIGPAILTYADEHDVDLVVMGTEGRTGLNRLVTGSVAEHVVREAPVPVVTVRADNQPEGSQ